MGSCQPAQCSVIGLTQSKITLPLAHFTSKLISILSGKKSFQSGFLDRLPSPPLFLPDGGCLTFLSCR